MTARVTRRRWLWLDTTFGCGGVAIEGYVVVDAAPIYRRLAMGRNIHGLLAGLRRAGRFRACKVVP